VPAAAEDVEPAAALELGALELARLELLLELAPQAASARAHRAVAAAIGNRVDMVSKSSWIGPRRR
jgi:hypothetical protein